MHGDDRSSLGWHCRVLSAGEQGITRLRRGAEQQDPRDPASRLWLARRGLSTAQNTDLHAARLVAELSSATSTSFVTFTVDLLARHSLIYKLAALERCGHDGQRKRLPTCPQQQKQPQLWSAPLTVDRSWVGN